MMFKINEQSELYNEMTEKEEQEAKDKESAVKINEPPRWGYINNSQLVFSSSPPVPPVKANQKWLKTPELLLQVDKINHIRKKKGGGTVFVMDSCDNLVEADLPFEEACRLLGYVE